ncbi:peptidoglycan DD-metalloendopeptidase family protein [Eubacterium sp. MSJ-13]|uniref:peptidoglycan DD-metalloendopeptidase family protein n=1 Tax=Eubacterium sp. MSJ-13 TaxID=2841513 RepID=UPI001C1204F1|nr:M23 family metallopeptidase [Eubacterium sp. MSJ-13]MBU5477909.1 peptidoglycan DD-metalloendopeptidase family protein [Eubacterium sp. MSJ-13]
MYDNKENNFKKKGLCVSLCAALVCGLGIGGVYYKMNKAPQNDGTKLFSDSSTGTKSADTNDKTKTSSDKKDNAAGKSTENKTVAAGSGAVKNIKKKTDIKSAREKLKDAKAESKADKDNSNAGADDKNVAAKTDDKKKGTDAKGQDNNIKNNEDTKKNKAVSTMSKDDSIKFDAEKGMIWPVGSSEKDIILKFSDSNTVYFKTLAQYKVNPAIVISAKADENVKAAAAGVVKSIKTSDETGTTVTVDIGNGYEAIYGQLKNLNVKNGQKIAKGDIVGHIAKPTKYYTVEGTNLYFQVKENGKSVDPLLLLK